MTAGGVTDPSFRAVRAWEQQRAVVQAVGIHVAGAQVMLCLLPRLFEKSKRLGGHVPIVFICLPTTFRAIFFFDFSFFVFDFPPFCLSRS
jgi:hypothetical protein